MAKQIKDIYLVQHSHTDIGYTDLQERVIYSQITFITDVIKIVKAGYENDTADKDFKWNCETYYCVERFFEDATEEEKEDFFDLVKKGNIGISATYLNSTDLVDADILNSRIGEIVEIFKNKGIKVTVAMNADINGIHMGARDAFIEHGVEFLFTNLNTHHGMFPVEGAQKAYYWQNEAGKKLLVLNCEHYHAANSWGLTYTRKLNETGIPTEFDLKNLKNIHDNIEKTLKAYAIKGYDYDFIAACISGVLTDNSPPSQALIRTINMYNAQYDNVKIHMVTIQDLYELIKDKIKDAPVYQGDLNDWWAHGVNSTPYPVKHYKEAVRMYHLTKRLNKDKVADVDKYLRIAEDNILLYSEHTWGHSSTITNPYDTMVLNLDMRKNSYASKAHEASAMALNRVQYALGDILHYYDLSGKFKAVNPSNVDARKAVEVYLHTWTAKDIKVVEDVTGKEIVTQLVGRPRGVVISFVDDFKAGETKTYSFSEIEVSDEPTAEGIGINHIKDIVTTHSDTFDLLHKIENDYFRLEYDVRNGITSFYNKVEQVELLKEGDCKFFTPIYEVTDIRTSINEERSKMGRNIRGIHSKLHFGELDDIMVLNHGKVFTTIELVFALKGTIHTSVVICMYHQMPKIDFKFKFGKTMETAVENLFVPISLNLDKEVTFNKGGVRMRHGVDQIPYTNNEYYVVDNGIVYGDNLLIRSNDAPMIYTGELKHHAIRLCENNPEDNKRDMYSWVMNNIWETNFKMDLGGFSEFCYSLEITNKISSAKDIDELCMDVATYVIE